MSRRLLIFASLLLCIAVVVVLVVQRWQISNLRDEQRRTLADQEASQSVSSSPSEGASVERPDPPSELLRLRGEVGRLRIRRGELAGVVDANTRLRKRVEQREANVVTNFTLPSGYKLRSQARFVGYGTPEQTLESFLWAVHNQDVSGILRALTPDDSRQMKKEMKQTGGTSNLLHTIASGLPGVHVLKKMQIDPSVVELQIEIVPGLDYEPGFRFHQIGKEWKMEIR